MANRICRMRIKNTGEGTLELIGHGLEHGAWMEDWEPWVTAASIAPGEERRFQAEEDGIFTGNEGWVLYKTFGPPGKYGSPEQVFVKIRWNLPYIPASINVPGTDQRGSAGVFDPEYRRYDFRDTTGAGEFEDRDLDPIGLHHVVNAYFDGDGDDWGDAFPAILIPPLVVAEANLSVNAHYTFTNTRKPGSTKVPPPFTTGSKPQMVPEAMIHTNASMWAGEWAGERMWTRVIPTEGGQLQLEIKDLVTGEASMQTIAICKLKSVAEFQMPNEIDQILVVGANVPHAPHPRAIPEGVELQVFEEDDGRLGPESIQRFEEMRDTKKDGDYLEVEPNAVLELCQMKANGIWVDTAIRYRYPASNAFLAVAGTIDDLLYFVPQVN
jgi:hypothetical protein